MVEWRIRIPSGDRITATWGVLHQAIRKTTVARREPDGVETFNLSWGTLTAQPGEDWVIQTPGATTEQGGGSLVVLTVAKARPTGSTAPTVTLNPKVVETLKARNVLLRPLPR